MNEDERLTRLRDRLAYLHAKRPRNWRTEARKLAAAIRVLEAASDAR